MSEESRGGVLGNNTTDILDQEQEQDHDQEMRPNHNHSSRRYENHNYRNIVPERPVKKILKKKKKSNSGKICSYTGVILVILIVGAFLLVKFQKEIESTGLFNFIPSKPLETRIPQTEKRNDQDPKLKINEIDNSETNHVQVDNQKDIPLEEIHNQPKQSITTDLFNSPYTPDPPAQLRNFEISSTSGSQDVEKTSAINKEPEKEVVEVKLPDNPTTKHLFEAIKDGHVPLASALINYGVDLKMVNEDGQNPLHYAASLLKAEVIGAILAKIPENERNQYVNLITINDGNQKTTALHLVAANADKDIDGAVESARSLIQNFANIDQIAAYGFTALLMAVMCSSNSKLIYYLLDHGANPNIQIDGLKSTALHLAMLKCNDDVITALLTNRSDKKHVDSFLLEPIHEAASKGCKAGIRHLLNSGIDVNTKTLSPESGRDDGFFASKISYGSTPLHFAAKEGKLEIVEYLLRCDAWPTVSNFHGKSALSYAQDNNHSAVRDVILNFQAQWQDPNSRLNRNRTQVSS